MFFLLQVEQKPTKKVRTLEVMLSFVFAVADWCLQSTRRKLELKRYHSCHLSQSKVLWNSKWFCLIC